MMFTIKLALAGLGHMVAHWSVGLIIIAACLVAEFASGWLVGYLPFLAKPIAWAQKYLIFVAVGTALVLLGEWIGARDVADRCEAKAAVVNEQVDDAVKNATKSPGLDKWDIQK